MHPPIIAVSLGGMTRPTPRPEVDAIAAYRPGRSATSEADKLSSNELPFPPLPGVVERAHDELRRMNRYPDAGVTRLYDALAARHEVAPDQLAAGTGSVAVLFSLLSAFCGPGDEIVYPWRSFEAYPIAADLTGASSVRVPLRADATHDVDAMIAAVTDRTKVVLVCTPNNPTGPVVTAAELDALLAAVPPHVVVVVDEAYVEFVRHPDAADGLAASRRHPNVVVLRTFSKAYGLAGLRVGYAIGDAAVTGAIRKTSTPFGVTDVAQAAALASLAAVDELERRVATVVDQRGAVLAGLRGQGWEVPDAQGNFVWLPLGDDSLEFAASCEPLSVRPFAGEGVRVSIGAPEVNDTFLAVANRWRTGV